MADRNTALGAMLKYDSPVVRLGLAMVPALAVATRADIGLALGVATVCVVVCTSLVASILGKLVPEKGRLAVLLLTSAAFATFAAMLLRGWYPALAEAMGLYAPLMAVSCLALCRAKDFADGGSPLAATGNAIGMGVAFVAGLTVVSAVRELIGHGSLFGAAVLSAGFEPMVMMVMPAGGLLALGVLLGVCNALSARNGKKEASK